MVERILFVCIGNICRSPMAEALLKAKLKEKAKQLHISSAGIAALVDEPAAKPAQALMREHNIDLTTHRARQLDAKLVKESDVIFTMDEMQKQHILKRYPFATGKTFLLGDPVPDPYGLNDEDYVTAFTLIEKGINTWQKKLCKC